MEYKKIKGAYSASVPKDTGDVIISETFTDSQKNLNIRKPEKINFFGLSLCYIMLLILFTASSVFSWELKDVILK